MELLRRALLVGCLLAGLWLVRLAPLDPLVTIRPIDFAEQQRQEAASVPDAQKTEAQRRRAEIPLPVYIEEFLQFNVFPATGPEWDQFLAEVDGRARLGSADAGIFMHADDERIRVLADKLAAAGGTTYVSMSRPGGDAYYRIDQHRWNHRAFHLGKGFTGTPAPPASMLYPFRAVGLVCMLTGALLFTLLPSQPYARKISVKEALGLALGVVAFALPLLAVGESVQALTRATWLTTASWMVTAVGMHVFASPLRTAPGPLIEAGGPAGTSVAVNTLFVRKGLTFLLLALGPLAFLIWATMMLWNR